MTTNAIANATHERARTQYTPGHRLRSLNATPRPSAAGFSLLELLLTLSTTLTTKAIAIALTATAIDDMRTATATRYIAERIGAVRLDAVRHSSSIALRFETAENDYTYAPYENGDGNNVRTTNIRSDIDRRIGTVERLGDKFPSVTFQLLPETPNADSVANANTDGVRIGTSQLLTVTANGTTSSKTLYIRKRKKQYAVRILNITRHTRMLKYRTEDRTWLSR